MREIALEREIAEVATDTTSKRVEERIEKMYRDAPKRDRKRLRNLTRQEIEERMDI